MSRFKSDGTDQHARRLIDAYLLDNLDEQGARTLAEHVRACPECAAELGSASTRLIELLRTLPEPPASPDLDQRIYAAVIADRERRVQGNLLGGLARQIVRGAMRTTGTVVVTIVGVALIGGAFVFAASQFIAAPPAEHPRATLTAVVPPTSAPTESTRSAFPSSPPVTETPTRPAPTVVPGTESPSPTPRITLEPTLPPTPIPTDAASGRLAEPDAGPDGDAEAIRIGQPVAVAVAIAERDGHAATHPNANPFGHRKPDAVSDAERIGLAESIAIPGRIAHAKATADSSAVGQSVRYAEPRVERVPNPIALERGAQCAPCGEYPGSK